MCVTLTKSQNVFSTIDIIGTVIQLNWLQNGFQERLKVSNRFKLNLRNYLVAASEDKFRVNCR